MTRPGDSAKLQRILSIREVQLVASKDRVVRAAETLRERAADQSDKERACNDVEKQWLALLSAPLIPMEILPSLRTAYLREEGALRQATQNVEEAAADLALHKSRLYETTAHRDVAKLMVRRAIKQEEKKREEAAASDIADRYARRVGMS